MILDQQLRRLDPAGDIHTDLGRSARAEATFAAITSSEPGGDRTPARSRRHRRAGYSLAAAAAAVGVLVAPVFTGGGTAYASWTAIPRPATTHEAADWVQKCQKVWPGHHYKARLVEVRGQWAYTVLTGTGGYEATCLATAASADGAVQGGGFEGPLDQTPPADGLVTNSVREFSADTGEDDQFEVTGKAGPLVAAVAFQIEGTDVQATLDDGYFAAWWPQHRGTNLLSRLTDQGPPNPKVKITLRDGTTHLARIQKFDVSTE